MSVSVLIAVYNGAESIEAAIDGILDQTYRDFELIIVNDGSSDGTAEILKKFEEKDSRIRVLHNTKNLGFPASLNIGWRAARNELIALNDADDVSLPLRLELQTKFMAAHPEIDVLGAGVIIVDQHGAEVGEFMRPKDHQELVRQAYKENFFFHPTVMFRRTFLEALEGYDSRLRRAQDCDLFLRGYRRFHYNNLPHALVRYRLSGRPSWSSIFWGAYVLAKNAWREGLIFSKGFYAIRWLLGMLLIRLNIFKPRLHERTDQ